MVHCLQTLKVHDFQRWHTVFKHCSVSEDAVGPVLSPDGPSTGTPCACPFV